MEDWKEGEDIVGRVHVPAFEHTRSYETAAWWKTLDVPTQNADLVEVRSRFNGHARTCWLVRLHSTVSGASFRSRLGACYGTDRGPEEVGNPETLNVVLASRDWSYGGKWHVGDYGPLHDTPEEAAQAFMESRGWAQEPATK